MKLVMSNLKHGQRGSALVQAVTAAFVLFVVSMGFLSLARYNDAKQFSHTAWAEAYYAAENGLLEGVQRISEVPPTQPVSSVFGTYNKASLPHSASGDVTSATYVIGPDPLNQPTFYSVISSAEVRGKTRTIQARVQYRPPSQVFDYEYFLNNWGWWWGASITGNGDNRSNWDFDYKDRPTVNGHIYASGNVESNLVPVDPFSSTPFRGWAGDDPITYVHVGAARLKMPNLKDLSYYEARANGTIRQGSNTIVTGIQGDNEPKQGLYLRGTDSAPIRIDGTVVVRGDVVLSGRITGTGTLYVGGNLYLAGNVQYANGPTFQLPPNHASLTPAQRQAYYDTWVDQAFAGNKDLIGFGVRGHILAGQVWSSDWKSSCFDNSTYGLKNLGREDNLGRDGIRGTPDDGVRYIDKNGDGIPDSAEYDADEDGVIRTTTYNYTSDINFTSTRFNNLANLPKDSNGQTVTYSSFTAADQSGAPNPYWSRAITELAGIYYTNHAIAQKSSSGPQHIRGSMVCRDEAIIFSNSLTFWYDWRVHSRYLHKFFDNNGNRIIDLDLPLAYKTRIWDRHEKTYGGNT
jgi:hypothetical protein